LKALKGNKTVKIMGVAMSAATVIMLAGDRITANAGDIIMIHEAKCEAWENFDAEAAQRLVNVLSTCNKAMAELYAKKTGKGVQEILNAMHAETWLTAQQALDYGLIDEVIDSGADQVKLVASMDRKKLYAAGRELNLRGMSLPESITKLLPTEAAPTPGTTAPSAPSAKSGKNTLKEEGEKMEPKTVAELEAAHPDLVKAIREQAAAEAKAKERARIEEIEKIESSLCMSKEAIFAAKFGESPSDARDLAFISAQQQAMVGADKLAAMQADAEKSGANKVTAAGNDGSANTNTAKNQAQAEVKAMLEKFAGKFN
jgi:ClpP class serine protease